jgi:hypothetical protein
MFAAGLGSHPNPMLQRTLQQVPFESRNELLEGSNKENKQEYDTFLKVNYTPDLDTQSLRNILKPNNQKGVVGI